MVNVSACFCFFLILCLHVRTCCFSRNTDKEQMWNYCTRRYLKLTCTRIPKEIPDGIKTVHLINIEKAQFPDGVLRNGTFRSDSWRQVEDLQFAADKDWLSSFDTVQKFDSYCFSGLEKLKTLGISLSSFFEFTPKTLSGLNNLYLLDLSGCRRLEIDSLVDALSGPDLLPNLRAINISLLNSFRSGLKLTDKFFRIISEKRIRELDISSVQILYLNMTSLADNCESLEYINASRSMLNDIDDDGVHRVCPKLRYIDASFISLPTEVTPDRGPHRKTISNMFIPLSLKWTYTKSYLNVEFINLSGIIPKDISYVLRNVTVFLVGASKFSLTTLISRDNNFERLDMKIIMRNASIRSFDLSNCGIRFLNPGVISSLNLLMWIDISDNRLSDMVTEDLTLFGKLFENLSQLRYINLAGNKLPVVPFGMFESNPLLEVIDLSNNILSQVRFDTESLKKIKVINLSRNVIKVLDDISLSSLHFVVLTYSKFGTKPSTQPIVLKENPISCSQCKSLSFLKWLVKAQFSISDYQQLKCETERHKKIHVDHKAIDSVHDICERPKVIIASCITVATVVTVATLVVLFIRRRRRQKQYKLEMEDRIALIREGAENREFVVFLSFSSKDDEFVNNNVIGPLNEHLQNMIGDFRDLVCEGDRNFQLGRPIHDQISELLKKSSVVVVVLSNNYSLSVHCRNEFDQAFLLERPIVLMIKDEVDTELMMPLIRDMYEKRTRILWTRENGQYVLKTTWENVCTSIIELVDCN